MHAEIGCFLRRIYLARHKWSWFFHFFNQDKWSWLRRQNFTKILISLFFFALLPLFDFLISYSLSFPNSPPVLKNPRPRQPNLDRKPPFFFLLSSWKKNPRNPNVKLQPPFFFSLIKAPAKIPLRVVLKHTKPTPPSLFFDFPSSLSTAVAHQLISLSSLCPISPLWVPEAAQTGSDSFLPGHPYFGEAFWCLVCACLALCFYLFIFINLGCFNISPNGEDSLSEEEGCS